MKLAIGIALQLLDDPAVRQVRREVFVATPGSRIRRLNRPGWPNRLVSRMLSISLDSSVSVRRNVIRYGGGGTLLSNKKLDLVDPAELLKYVTPVFHPSGTCAIGRADNPLAVLDANCQVRHVSRLHVVDASVMPCIPRGNTCLPVMMIAEHVAGLHRSMIK